MTATFVKSIAFALSIGILASTACAASHDPKTDWLKDAGWGVMVTYLWDIQNAGGRASAMGKPPVSWDECVVTFDTERFADEVKKAGAGYVIFTMMQRTRYIIAPNETYEKLTGYNRGEATSHRDLVEDLYQSLHKRGISLMLYWTGDGPRQDKQADNGLGGYSEPVTEKFVENWANVAAEYSKRYGNKVRGWWVDGCGGGKGGVFDQGYNDKLWGIMARAVKSGNHDAIVALSNSAWYRVNSTTEHDDFTAGEMGNFSDFPLERWRDGKQFHVVSTLRQDQNWGDPGNAYTLEYLADYVSQIMAVGGAVTFDFCVYRDGSADPEQVKILGQIRQAIKDRADRAPIPSDNLACWKSARLLTLDGKGALRCNGDIAHTAFFGLDGDPNTYAQAAWQWPWTFEVDLKKPEEIGRIVITFGKSFATEYEVVVSADGKQWETVAAKKEHDGSKAEHRFDPVKARYVRVRGIKPDGPDQPGVQMQIAELEVYHTS